MNDLFNARRYIRSAFGVFAAIICILLVLELIAHAPFGPLLMIGIVVYAAYRIWTAGGSKRSVRRPRSTGGAERIPLHPGGHQ